MKASGSAMASASPRAADGEEERIAEALQIDAIAKNLGDEFEGEFAVRIEERAAERGADRPDEEAGKERRGQRVDEPGEGLRHGWDSRVPGAQSQSHSVTAADAH